MAATSWIFSLLLLIVLSNTIDAQRDCLSPLKGDNRPIVGPLLDEDDDTALTMFPDQTVTESGYVSSITYYASRRGRFYVSFWSKPNHVTNTYILQSMITVHADSSNVNESFTPLDFIEVEQGQVLAIHYPNEDSSQTGVVSFETQRSNNTAGVILQSTYSTDDKDGDWEVGDQVHVSQADMLHKAVALHVTVCRDRAPAELYGKYCLFGCAVTRGCDAACAESGGIDAATCTGMSSSARKRIRSTCDTIKGDDDYPDTECTPDWDDDDDDDHSNYPFPYPDWEYGYPHGNKHGRKNNRFPKKRDVSARELSFDGRLANLFTRKKTKMSGFISSISFRAQREGSFFVSFWTKQSSRWSRERSRYTLHSKIQVNATSDRDLQTFKPAQRVIVEKNQYLVVHYGLQENSNEIGVVRFDYWSNRPHNSHRWRDYDDGWEEGYETTFDDGTRYKYVDIYVTICACDDGYNWENGCETQCNETWFGPNCKYNCTLQKCQLGSTCNHVTGRCDDGCQSGYDPPFCTIKTACDKWVTMTIVLMCLFMLITLPLFCVALISICANDKGPIDEATAKARQEYYNELDFL